MKEKIRCHLSSVYTVTEIYSSNRKILLDHLRKNRTGCNKMFLYDNFKGSMWRKKNSAHAHMQTENLKKLNSN